MTDVLSSLQVSGRYHQAIRISALVLVFVLAADVGEAQSPEPPSDVITLPRGSSELLNLADDVNRVAVADSSVAGVVALSPRELLIDGRSIGGTTLIVWDSDDRPRTYAIDVTFDVGALERLYATAFPDEAIEVRASGNIIVLSGTVSGGEVARRVVEIAKATDATVVEHLVCVRPSVSC